jgi:ABC-type Fe3+/spermidine/putrescine transport system ATPase subunit
MLQQVGRPDELYESPANVFVASFLGESNLLSCRLAGAEGPHLAAVTAGGTRVLVAARPGPAAGGGRLLLRPESLRITVDGGAGPAGVPGTVEEVVYLGGVRRYAVRINARETLVAREPNRAGVGGLPAGSRVTVSWDPADARLLPDEG